MYKTNAIKFINLTQLRQLHSQTFEFKFNNIALATTQNEKPCNIYNNAAVAVIMAGAEYCILYVLQCKLLDFVNVILLFSCLYLNNLSIIMAHVKFLQLF